MDLPWLDLGIYGLSTFDLKPEMNWGANFLRFILKIEKKTIIFASKWVKIHYFDLNLAKYSQKLRKGQYFLENLNFTKISETSAPKIWNFMPLKPDFLRVSPPLSQGFP